MVFDYEGFMAANGKTPPGYNVLFNAALKYNVDVHYVFFGKGEAFRTGEGEAPDMVAQMRKNSPYSEALYDFFRFMFASDYTTLQVLLMYERLKLSDDPLIRKEVEAMAGKKVNEKI